MAKRRKLDGVVPAHIVGAIHPFDVGLQRFVRAAYEAKRKPRKPHKPSSLTAGRRPRYNRGLIIAVAKEVAADTSFDSQAGFLDEVRFRLEAERRAEAPKVTQLKEIAGPIYRRTKRRGR
jgi:hypothetical protein